MRSPARARSSASSNRRKIPSSLRKSINCDSLAVGTALPDFKGERREPALPVGVLELGRRDHVQRADEPSAGAVERNGGAALAAGPDPPRIMVAGGARGGAAHPDI